MSTHDNDREAWFTLVRQQVKESDKNWGVAFCLSLFMGVFGADRFYLDSPWLGFLKLFTFGGFGVWWLADVILLLTRKMKDGEGKVVNGI